MLNSLENESLIVTEGASLDLSERVRLAVARRPKSYRYPWLQRGYSLQFREIEWAVIEEVRRCSNGSLEGRKILDIGCGAGGWLREFVKWGAEPESLYGIDMLADRLEMARNLCAPGVHLFRGSATELNFASSTFDFVMLFQAMSLMLDEQTRVKVASEALRVLKPGGAVLWYDYRYHRPEMKGLLRPVSKAAIRRLFPDCTYHIRSIHPLPPVSRRLALFWHRAWDLLNIVPLLRTCYAGAIIKHQVTA